MSSRAPTAPLTSARARKLVRFGDRRPTAAEEVVPPARAGSSGASGPTPPPLSPLPLS